MRKNRILRQQAHATPPPGRRPGRRAWLAAAPLAACLAAACPAAAAAAATATSAGGSGGGPLNCAPPGQKGITCYTPQQYQVAYGVAPLLRHGVDGRGETVVFPELASSPSDSVTDIRQAFAAFDSAFSLPPASLQVVNTLASSPTPYLASDEEVEDTEIVHAMAPGATLEVVLVPQQATSSTASFAAALAKVIQAGAAGHAAAVSISASEGEHFLTRAEIAELNTAIEQARAAHVTVVAASGDNGAISDDGPPRQVSMPASDPLVLGVGGTELDLAEPAGTYQGEMAWNGGDDGSGGGYSFLFPRPAYQDGVTRAAGRGVPDVSADADEQTGMALDYGNDTIRAAAGTSGSTPLWAGVIALADQEAGHHLGFVNPAIYAITCGPSYHRAFNDVVTGDNSVLGPDGVVVGYNAGPGWDPVTGWGSPDAQYLVPLLAHAASSGA
jgi:subtilase family serine protease